MNRVALRCTAAVCVLTAMLVACGGRSSLEVEPRDSGVAGTTGGTTGGSFTGSFGGTPSTVAGTFGMLTGGMPAGGMAVGGTFAGGMPVGGMTIAGAGGVAGQACQLSTSDCASENEPECAGVLTECKGSVLHQGSIWGTRRAHVNAIATAVDGRVAVVGYFEGLLNVDEGTLPTVADGDDGFALVFDSDGKYLWSHFWNGPGAQAVTGVDFAPGGDLVVQGGVDEAPGASAGALSGLAFVARLDQQGQLDWSYPIGKGPTRPFDLGVDNDGNISLVGGFNDELDYQGAVQGVDSAGNYVLHLDPNGGLIWSRTSVPEKWLYATATKLVVDDEDNLVLLGEGQTDDSLQAGYVQKLSSNGNLQFSRDFRASVALIPTALAVDRKMEIVVGGDFEGTLTLNDVSFSSANPFVLDSWFAKLNRDGGFVWVDSKAASKEVGSHVGDIVTDPPGNTIFAIDNGDQIDVSKRRDSGFVVWKRAVPAVSAAEIALASDNVGNVWLAANYTEVMQVDGGGVTKPKGEESIMLLQLSR